MSKYVFKRNSDAFYTDTKIVVSFTANELEEVLEEFTYFLKGCGFEMDGKVCVVTDKIETNDDEPFNYGDDDVIKVFSGNYTDESFKTDHHVRQPWPWPDSDDDAISLVNSSPIMSTINLDNIQITTMNDNISSSLNDDIIIVNVPPSQR